MNEIVLEEKKNLIAPFFIILLVFFAPLSVSIKSIMLGLSIAAVLLTPYYRSFLWEAFNTLWARTALVFFMYVILACLWSEAPYSYRFDLIEKYSKLIYLPFISVGFIHPKTRKWALNSYLLAMLITCFISLLIHKGFLPVRATDLGKVFYNHIVTSFMVALAVYFAAILFLQENKNNKWLRVYYIIMMIFGSYQIFFINMGRTGYVVYILLMSLLMIQKLSIKRAIIYIILFLGSVCFIYTLSPMMQLRVGDLISEIKLTKQHNKENSIGFRVQFHDYAKKLFEEHPIIGVGSGGFKYRFNQDKPVATYWNKKTLNDPHSQYWLVLSELGGIGFLLYLAFLGSLFSTAFRLSTEIRPIFLGMLVSFCFCSITDSILCYSAIGTFLIIISSLCFGELIRAQSRLRGV